MPRSKNPTEFSVFAILYIEIEKKWQLRILLDIVVDRFEDFFFFSHDKNSIVWGRN